MFFRESNSVRQTFAESKIASLSTEVLLAIISHVHDAPSAVCFALTNKRHYNLVLAFFEVSCLQPICPQDVRSRFPIRLEPFVHSILTPREGGEIWPPPARVLYMNEFLATWATIRMDGNLQPLVWSLNNHLAFIRRHAWLVDSIKEVSSSRDAELEMIYVPRLRHEIPASKELANYVVALTLDSVRRECQIKRLRDSGLPSEQPNKDCIESLLSLWDQPVIKSMEYLELKGLLTEWERSLTKWDRFWTSMVEQFEFHVPGDVEAYLEEQEGHDTFRPASVVFEI